MSDLLVRDAVLQAGGDRVDVLIRDGLVAAVEPRIQADVPSIDADGCFVCPPFVDAHFHMDSTLTYGMPRTNDKGTLLEGIEIWGELKPTLTVDAIRDRALRFCRWAVARGTLAIRSHVDVSDPRLLAVHALLEVRRTMAPYLDLQLVAFPQDGLLRGDCGDNMARALDLGVDVVGGIPHHERTMAAGAESVRILCELAERRGLLVDMHCDESDDPLSRHVEALAYETRRLGLHGRVTGSHLTSMHSMDDYYVSKLLPLMAEAELHAVANPLINITLQGRHDGYPKRRGMTRVPELLAAEVNVAFGHDCVMDPWYALGSHDMLEVASMGVHVAQMTDADGLQDCFDAVTTRAARVLHLDGYGLEPGCRGDLVVLQCGGPVEALRLKPARLFVVRGGDVISSTPPVQATVQLGGECEAVDFRF